MPTADETADSVRRAQRALIEIAHRRDAEERNNADEAIRDQELARWHANDTHTNAPTRQRRRWRRRTPKTAAQ